MALPTSNPNVMHIFGLRDDDLSVIEGPQLEQLLNAINKVLLAKPDHGFPARIYVLFAITAFCIITGFAYVAVTIVDYQRRGKKFWLWRMVHRPGGRFIVGNQHVLFSIMGTICCILLIGYENDALLTFSRDKAERKAFYWRTLIYLPIIFHGWIASFANLQASVLSSQKMLNKHVLSPKLLNSIYIGGLTILLVITVTLNVHASRAWGKVWNYGKVITNTLMVGEADFKLGDLDQALLAQIKPEAYKLDDEIKFFDHAEQVVGGFYVFSMATLIAINVVGLSLVLTLRKQINFNTRRFSADVRSASKASGEQPVTLNSGVFSGFARRSNNGLNETSSIDVDAGQRSMIATILDPVSEMDEAHSDDEKVQIESITLPRPAYARDSSNFSKVAFAPQFPKKGGESDADQDIKDRIDPASQLPELNTTASRVKRMSVARIKTSVQEGGTTAVALREQGKNLLALKKIKSDLVVFIAAIVLLSFILLATSLWMAIGPSKIYRHWVQIELSLFLFPWAYVVTMAIAHSFLLYNAFIHLTPASDASVPCVKALLPSYWRKMGRETVTGLTSMTDKGEASVSSVSMIAVQTNVEVREDMHDESTSLQPVGRGKRIGSV